MKIINGRYTDCINYCDELFKDSYFSFSLAYVRPDEPFKELWRFLWESRHQTRYKNAYKGNVVIDISAWAGQIPVNEYFFAFLYYLKDNEQSLTCAIISENRISSNMYSAIEKLYPVEVIDLTGGTDVERDRRIIGFSVQNSMGDEENVQS